MNTWAIERARIPNVTLKTLLRLSKTMVRDGPEVDSPWVLSSLDRLKAQNDEIDAALAKRFRALNQVFGATEVGFDRGADTLWVWLRRLLEGWRDAYGHPGLDGLSAALQAEIDLPLLREKAARARALHERLFGAEGTNWITASFIEQSETMATILRVIEQDNLTDDLTMVVGGELPKVLAAVQVQYEDMVSARMVRDSKSDDNLSVLRARLRFRLDHYKTAIESLREPGDPASAELVAHALRALTMLNQRLSSGATPQEIEEFADAELVDLGYEQEAAAEAEAEDTADSQPESESEEAVNA